VFCGERPQFHVHFALLTILVILGSITRVTLLGRRVRRGKGLAHEEAEDGFTARNQRVTYASPG